MRYYPGTLFRCVSERGERFVFEVLGPGRTPLHKVCRVVYDDSTGPGHRTFEGEYTHKHLNKYGRRMGLQEQTWKTMKVSVDFLQFEIERVYEDLYFLLQEKNEGGYNELSPKLYKLKDQLSELLVAMSKLCGVDDAGNAVQT